MSEAPPAGSWFRVGVADVLFVVLIFGMMQRSRSGMLDDPGVGWHIRNIDAMLEQGGWLTHDPFTLNRGDQRWFTNQWLGDLLLWLGYRWAGLNGIAVVVTLVLALTIRLLYGMLIRDGVPWPMAFLWAVLAALGTSSGWVARPNIFTILFTLITARTCDLLHRGEPCRPWLLVPLFTIWANTHGGFIAGFIILVASIGIEVAVGLLADVAEDRLAAWQRAKLLTMVTAGSAAATLINPYGIELYAWIFQLLGDPYFMKQHVEWLSPNFHEGGGTMRYELLILLLPLIVAYSEKKPSLLLLCLSVLWLHLALGGLRYVTLFVVVVTPLLARHSIDIVWLKERAARWLSADMKMLLGNRPDRPAWFWSVVVAFGLLGWARVSGPFAAHDSKFMPAQALDRVLANHRGQVIFHDYGWGGYLTWHGWDREPRVLNWIDDRNEVQGRPHMEDYYAITGAAPGWQAKLDADRVEVVVLRPAAELVRHLRQEPGWRQTYADPFAVIFERTKAGN